MTPTPAKPSKFITHLTEQLHKRELEIGLAKERTQQLEGQLAQERADRHRDLETIARHERQLVVTGESNRSLSARIKSLGVLIEVQQTELQASAEKTQALEKAHAASMALNAGLDLLVDALRGRIAELEQRSKHLDAKESELRQLVAKVEARGRRREAEEANAILNRRALAGAVPGRNHR